MWRMQENEPSNVGLKMYRRYRGKYMLRHHSCTDIRKVLETFTDSEYKATRLE